MPEIVTVRPPAADPLEGVTAVTACVTVKLPAVEWPTGGTAARTA